MFTLQNPDVFVLNAEGFLRNLRRDTLADEITELCAYLNAANYRLLEKIREFDRDEHWGVDGICSCAHWLNWKCGIGMNAAREKVRVANALGDLPKISEAFEKGEISYSKVRAMTRVATADNEDYLLMIARHGTAYHVETLVRKYRRARKLQDLDEATTQHEERSLHVRYEDDGLITVIARLPAEKGALVVKAIEQAVDEEMNTGTNVSAETSKRICCDAGISVLSEDEDGTPMNIGRKSRVIPSAMRRALKARDENCRFPGCTHKYFVDGHHIRHWSDGGETSLDNLVRLCRQHHRLVHEGGFSCTKNQEGKIEFRNPGGQAIARTGQLPTLPANFDLRVRMRNRYEDLFVDASTCVPLCDDASIDWDLAVGAMFT